MIDKYIGIPYDLKNSSGLNCWALCALVYRDLFGEVLAEYTAKENSFSAISAAFTAAFAGGEHGFELSRKPENYCVIVMKHKMLTHCGIWLDGMVLHATSQAGQVIFQPEAEAVRQFKTVEYWVKA